MTAEGRNHQPVSIVGSAMQRPLPPDHGWPLCRIGVRVRKGRRVSPDELDQRRHHGAIVWARMSNAERRVWHIYFCCATRTAQTDALITRVETEMRALANRKGGVLVDS